ncbi:MAG: hypothetical protein HN778_09845 [Prolixibacteraceae bacterium]|nr:hypothetical protein [Prolixibacteraceae bacterium]MBT6766467.1 hypothetical protein [Prolixibacteraceae bacterium]MBT7395122.1 hypothetical protein [Prolixibacteraceae bacterium]
MLESFKQRFKLDKPIIVADSGLLSKNNIESLIAKQYTFILGARIKNEAYAVVSQIEKLNLKNGETTEISKGERLRLIISFPDKRATKDKFNREMGLKRLEKKINAGIQEKGDDTASFSTFKPTQVVYGVFSAEQIQH